MDLTHARPSSGSLEVETSASKMNFVPAVMPSKSRRALGSIQVIVMLTGFVNWGTF